MGTYTNKGNQVVYYDYGQSLTAKIFTESRAGVIPVGVISGVGISIVGSRILRIAPGTFDISDGNRTVTIRTQADYDFDIGLTDYLYLIARYSSKTTEPEYEDYFADFVVTDTPGANDIKLAKISYAAGDISAVEIDYPDNRTNGLRVNDYDVYVEANSQDSQ